MPKFSPEEWKEEERSVDSAEGAERDARKASWAIAEGGAEDVEAEILHETFVEKSGEAREALGEEGSPQREIVSLRWKNLTKAFRASRDIEVAQKEWSEKEARLLARAGGSPSGAQAKALRKIRDKQDALSEEREELLRSNPEAYFGLHLRDMKEMKRELESGRIVETAYVQRQAEKVALHARAGRPVMLSGHLGTGKTELAMLVARKYLGKEAVVISGSKNMPLSDLYGHQMLAVEKLEEAIADSYLDRVEKKFDAWKAEHPDADDAEKDRAHDRIKEAYKTMLQKGGTLSKFHLGPVYEAMRDGRPLIIDEVNAIPHEVLISLNHILTRKPGEKVRVQGGDGEEVVVKEGFSVIMTGNMNRGTSQYVDRQKFDPAFESRLETIEHNYLPQATEGPLHEEAGEENELYLILLEAMMDEHGNIDAPEGSLKKLWKLAQAARITQDLFAGRQVKEAYYFRQGGDRRTKLMLKSLNFSPRGLMSIIDQWREKGPEYELDYYVFEKFSGQEPADKAYQYQLFKDQFGFFQSDGWEQSPDYGSGGVVHSFDVPQPMNHPEKDAFLGPREVVEAAYGKPPERAAWPEMTVEDDGEESAGELDPESESLKEWHMSLNAELASLEQDVAETCDIA